MTREALVKFNPTDPDFKETRRTGMDVVRKTVSMASRASLRIFPSSTISYQGRRGWDTSSEFDVVVSEVGFDEIEHGCKL